MSKSMHEDTAQAANNYVGYYGASKSHLISIFIIFLLCGICYSNTLNAPFVLDDLRHINRNPQIRLTSLDFEKIYDAALRSPHSNRLVANVSFALNYYLGVYDPTGYHIFNIIVHFMNGVLVYFLALSTFRLFFSVRIKHANQPLPSPTSQSLNPSIRRISLFAAIIFMTHPVQSQSVTYIVQRMNSLAAMFYLLSLLLYIHGRLKQKGSARVALWVTSLLSWAFALGSKEIAATLPLVIFLYEWYFFQSLSTSWLKRNVWYLLLPLVIFALIAFMYLGSHPFDRISAVYEYRDFTMLERVLTQFRVVIFYISLLFCPHPSRLNLLHHFTVSNSLFDPVTTLMSFLLVASLMGLAVYFAKRNPLVSFCILWFFVHLVVESSVVGLELVFEHRLYLPMFGFAIVAAYLLFHLLSEKRLWALVISLLIILSLVTATYARNRIWQDDMTLWSDVLSKNPKSPRGHLNLGAVLVRLGRLDEGIAHYRQALNIERYYVRAHNNLGIALRDQGKLDEAIAHYYTALKINPEKADIYNNLALALKDKGNLDEAISHYRKALERNPSSGEVHNNLGIALRERGDLDEAITHYEKALRLDPLLSDAHFNLASALTRQGRLNLAIRHFSEVLRLNPDDGQTHHSLGNALAQQGKLDRAIEHLSRALEIKPNFVEAHSNLGLVLATKGKFPEAISHYERALEIEPDFAEAHNNLGLALVKKGNLHEAISHYERALRIEPESPDVLMNLGNALVQHGKLDQAVEPLSRALEIKPDFAEAHNSLGIALARQGKLEEAIVHFSEALRLKPDYGEARHNFGLALGQSDGSAEAGRAH